MVITSVQALIALTLAWGVFAFGATYEWASRPLMIGCLVSGGLACWVARPAHVRVPAVTMALVGLAIGLQLVPLPPPVLRAVSPTAVAVLNQFDLLFAMQGGAHPLSIQPALTWQAFGLFVSFAILLAGLTRLLSVTGPRWVIGVVTTISVLIAIVGIAARALGDPSLVYGFWKPIMPGSPFGPFVNRNHFGGWMLMALPLTIAFVCGGIARGWRHVKPTLRHRVLWFGSAEASRLILAGSAAVIMALALVLTMSRSGMAAFAVSLAVTGGVIAWRMDPTPRRSVAWLYLAALAALVIAWVGVDAIAARWGQTNWAEFGDRRGAWLDAMGIARRFVWTGAGLNTYGTATMFFQQHDLALHYAQAHNDYLQLWAEGGLLIGIPAILLTLAAARHIRVRFREDEPHASIWWTRVGAVTGLMAIALQELVDFSLQMPANAALFIVLLAVALHRPAPRGSR